MINRAQASEPERRPRLRGGMATSPRAHAALSMLILGVAAFVALYLIIQRREGFTQRVEKMRKVQFEDLKLRAAAGQTAAQLALATAYSSGAGTTYDPTEAVKWNKAAAESGSPEAQFRLARALTEGEGTPINLTEAAALLRKSADQGNTEAQWTLGIYLYRGIGVEKNTLEAHRLLARAAASGSNPARLALEEIRKHMTPAELAAAEQDLPPAEKIQPLEKPAP